MGMNEDDAISEAAAKRLGRLPMKTTRKALQFSDFFRFVDIPKTQTYWKKKPAIPLRSYGNLEMGCCTRAKQAVASTRMERIESRGRVTLNIPDSEVIRVYREMSDRLYGGGDNGAYEDDALNEWRNPEKTFRDEHGHPHTIDAYLRINAANHDEVRAALALAGAKGIAACVNLPMAFARVDPPATWNVPKDQPLIGQWMPGSWGGHSIWLHGMTTEGPNADTTWELPPNVITWEACAAYMDEAHLVIDSVDLWRRKATTRKERTGLGDVIDAVNAASSIPIEA